ncbi:hypothetical protein FB550_12020 [Neobacillus bataviensis]|uniref:PRTase-CE domain-containing protein n=1 Tax=Neobacillus bataviensis TaxID=220685 RepID=A0A561CMY9_9BACI|nr:phosphoribosyltransferase [Neobacillus bataviensis]TWD92208.1 hypothetical protein FB550_12020 [Neobacillus bataviensis]
MVVTLGKKVSEQDIEKAIKAFRVFNNLHEAIGVYDSNFMNIEDKVNRWINQFNVEDQSLFLYLFTNLRYFDTLNIKEWYRKAYEEYKLIESDYMNSIYMPIGSFGGIMNGAIHMLHEFDSVKLGISRKRIAQEPSLFNNSFKTNDAKNLVLLDDIIGTGDTLMDFIIRCSTDPNTCKLFHNKKIYIFSMVMSKEARSRILRDLGYLGYESNIISKCIIDKSLDIEISFANEEDREKAKQIVRSYEKKVASDPLYIMGYKKSQALISFYFNTPNNTFSTFWESCEEKPWYSVFPRREDPVQFEIEEQENVILKNIREERVRVKRLAKELEEEKRAEMRRRGI